MKKVIAIIIVVLVLIAGGFVGIKYIKYKHNKELEELQALYNSAQSEIETLQIQNENLQNPPKIEVTVKTLKEYTAPASELITYKYYYTDAGTYSKSQTFGSSDISIPFTTDKTVYVFSGIISAGIDVSDIKYVVDESNNKIMVIMPEPHVLAHEIDNGSFETYDVKKSVFTSSDLSDYSEFEQELKVTQEEKLSTNSVFWDSVKNNSENVIRDILTLHDDVNDYQLEFSWVAD